MIGYKIQLFNYKPEGNRDSFLWMSNPYVYNDIEDLEKLGKIRQDKLYSTGNKFSKENDLDLFKATVLYDKLTSLGVNCKVVKVDYTKES
mgnify:CR=1 FL=1